MRTYNKKAQIKYNHINRRINSLHKQFPNCRQIFAIIEPAITTANCSLLEHSLKSEVNEHINGLFDESLTCLAEEDKQNALAAKLLWEDVKIISFRINDRQKPDVINAFQNISQKLKSKFTAAKICVMIYSHGGIDFELRKSFFVWELRLADGGPKILTEEFLSVVPADVSVLLLGCDLQLTKTSKEAACIRGKVTNAQVISCVQDFMLYSVQGMSFRQSVRKSKMILLKE